LKCKDIQVGVKIRVTDSCTMLFYRQGGHRRPCALYNNNTTMVLWLLFKPMSGLLQSMEYGPHY
jgi:hypothetical protein